MKKSSSRIGRGEKSALLPRRPAHEHDRVGELVVAEQAGEPRRGASGTGRRWSCSYLRKGTGAPRRPPCPGSAGPASRSGRRAGRRDVLRLGRCRLTAAHRPSCIGAGLRRVARRPVALPSNAVRGRFQPVPQRSNRSSRWASRDRRARTPATRRRPPTASAAAFAFSIPTLTGLPRTTVHWSLSAGDR